MRTLSNTVTNRQMVYNIQKATKPLREKIQQLQEENKKLIDTLLNKLDELEKFQDTFLKDKDRAHVDLNLLPCHDGWAHENSDVLLLMRQKSYREGYFMCIKEIDSILNKKLRNKE